MNCIARLMMGQARDAIALVLENRSMTAMREMTEANQRRVHLQHVADRSAG